MARATRAPQRRSRRHGAARSSSRPGAAWSARAPGTPRACASISRRPSRWRPKSGRASARCEALARLAIEASRLITPASASDSPLIELVERSASRVKELLPLLPGHAPWGAQADAALSAVALARGDLPRRRWPAALPSRHCRPGSTRTSASRSSSPRPGPILAGGPPEAHGRDAGLPPGGAVADGPGHG